MQNAVSYRNTIVYLLLGLIITFIAAYLYVLFLGTGWRAIVVVFGGSFLFLMAGAFLRDLRSFLLFMLIVVIPLQFGYHVIHDPLKDIESQPFSSGFAIDIVDVILFLLYSHWIIIAGHNKTGRMGLSFGGKLGGIFVAWILYVLVASFFTAAQYKYSVFEVLILIKGYLIFLYLINTVRDLKDFKLLIYGSFAGSLLHCFYIIGQFITKKNYTLHGELISYLGPEGFRSVGFFGSPDAASVLLSLVFPIALAYYMVVGDFRRKFLSAIGLSIAIIAIGFTKVRAAGVALVISTAVLLVLGYRRGWIAAKMVGKVAITFVVILALASPFILARFEKGTLGEDRLPLAKTAFNMIRENWILGVGANNYPLDIMKYAPVNFRHAWAYTVHNEYLLRLAETGIIGALLYYSMLLMMLIKLARQTRSPNPWIFCVSAGMFAALIGSIPHRMLSFYHYVNVFWQTSVFLALIYFMDNFHESRNKES